MYHYRRIESPTGYQGSGGLGVSLAIASDWKRATSKDVGLLAFNTTVDLSQAAGFAAYRQSCLTSGVRIAR